MSKFRGSEIVERRIFVKTKKQTSTGMGSLDASCLKGYSMLLGTLLILVSVSGIGFGVFLLFGEPLAQQTYHTYRPNFEDIGELAIDYLLYMSPAE